MLRSVKKHIHSWRLALLFWSLRKELTSALRKYGSLWGSYSEFEGYLTELDTLHGEIQLGNSVGEHRLQKLDETLRDRSEGPHLIEFMDQLNLINRMLRRIKPLMVALKT